MGRKGNGDNESDTRKIVFFVKCVQFYGNQFSLVGFNLGWKMGQICTENLSNKEIFKHNFFGCKYLRQAYWVINVGESNFYIWFYGVKSKTKQLFDCLMNAHNVVIRKVIWLLMSMKYVVSIWIPFINVINNNLLFVLFFYIITFLKIEFIE